MTRKLLHLLNAASAATALLASGTSHATVTGQTALSTSQFAVEAKPSSRLDLDLDWKGEGPDASEVRLIGFKETGPGGDWSIDLDPVAYHFNGVPRTTLWVGREHPIPGGAERSSAIGINWRLNEANALDPRVSGWVGTGGRYRFPGTAAQVMVAYSPLFIPNFGPSTTLSDTRPAEGSRFARLPPSYVRLNQDGSLVPLRYKVDIEDLREILLQNQFFAGVERADEESRVGLYAWSAPAPSADVDTSAALRVDETNLDVLVTAKPKFRRENFLAARARVDGIPLRPELQAALELERPRATLSASLEPLRGLRLGALHDLEVKHPTTDGVPESPRYADRLVWMDARLGFGDRFQAALRVERHLTPGREGAWVNPRLEWAATPALRLQAVANVLTGRDYGWFGTWRSLDSVALGARYLW